MNELTLSFEVFPPKSAEADERFWGCIDQLSALGPQFVSVTYGAGGSTRERTLEVVERLSQQSPALAAGHITCVGATRAETDAVLERYWAAGVKRIVALRGDPPGGIGAAYTPHADGYAYASDLVAGARAIADFDISVGCYPEGHPESRSPRDDLDNLKRKFDAGAARAITQFFYDADFYLRFLDRARAAGINKPIVPGIMLQSNIKGIAKMAKLCNAHLPSSVVNRYEGLDDDLDGRDRVTADVAVEICERLRSEGVNEFHFYSMNRASLPIATCRRLGVARARKAA